MLYSETDPESYTTEYTLVYEEPYFQTGTPKFQAWTGEGGRTRGCRSSSKNIPTQTLNLKPETLALGFRSSRRRRSFEDTHQHI